jgi:glutamyl-tRNA synthetase
MKTHVRTRFAPSPTGDLHLGGAWAALASWAMARSLGGTFVVRIEDLDTPRVAPGAEDRILEDLAWLGLVSDEVVCRQSERTHLYQEAIRELQRQGRVYPCECSRAEIARIASAPHPGEEVVYPGTCSGKDPRRPLGKQASLRFRVLPADEVRFDDLVCGAQRQAIASETGDFVLRRADGLFAYHLAVAVDDLAMRITHVVRGADLLESTPRQLLLMRRLSAEGRIAWAPRGASLPRYAHVPLVLDPSGERLAKRTRGATIRELRERGLSSQTVLGQLAHGLGLVPSDASVSPSVLASTLDGQEIRFHGEAWRIPG